jgi:hypothetical protein
MLQVLSVRRAAMRQIKESDWKILRQLASEALERFCKRVLAEIEQINTDSTKNSHQKYLSIYEIIPERDKELALLFDDLRRSTALIQLMGMRVRKLLTEDEFSRFSQETQDIIAQMLEN